MFEIILYHVITTYHLINAIVHSSISNETGVLICPEWFKQKFKDIEYLNCFFYKIIFVDINYRFKHSSKESKNYFKNKIGDLNQYSEIFVWGAQYSFGVILVENNKSFIFCEEGAGLLSRKYILKEIEKKLPARAKYYNEIEKLGIYDITSECIKFKLCNFDAQDSNYICDDTTINFNVIDELKKMKIENREKIIKFFDIKNNIKIKENSILLLTQNYANLNILAFEDQVLIYQLLLDYFFENDVLAIKPHPEDIIYYSRLFPEAEIIGEKFPSEFIPFIFNNQPKCIATISSTAIFNLHGVYPEIFELDTKFEKDFKMIHRYYSAIILAKNLTKEIVCVGTNNKLIQQLCKKVGLNEKYILQDWDNKKAINNAILLVDDINYDNLLDRTEIINILDKLNDDSLVIFINSTNDYCWYDYYHKYLWGNIKPIVLSKELFGEKKEDFYAELDDDVIYIYSKNKEVIKLIDEINIEKNLQHTGISINKINLTPEQERIKILEGILEATERRLLYYIEKENKENKL